MSLLQPCAPITDFPCKYNWPEGQPTDLITFLQDKSSEGENQFSLEKMESTLGELKNIFKQKEKLVDGL